VAVPLPVVAVSLSDADPELSSVVSDVPSEAPFWLMLSVTGSPAKAPSFPLSEFPLESFVIPPVRTMLDPVDGVVVFSDADTSAYGDSVIVPSLSPAVSHPLPLAGPLHP
jgi:hypothetical protein